MGRIYKRKCNFCNKEYKSEAKYYCSRNCLNKDNFLIKNLSKSWGKPRYANRGLNNKGWKGGISRRTAYDKEWKEQVKKRDNYKCVNCKNSNLIELRVHHIKDFWIYPNLRYEVDNGLTLCIRCHPLKHKELVNNLGKFAKKRYVD